MKEKIGTISEKLDEVSGIILGQNNKEYYFSILDFEDDMEIEIGKKVIFNEKCFFTNKENIYRAVLISKYEEENI